MTAPDLSTWQSAVGPRYTLTRELGGGGMSRVFLARESDLNRDVVVKLLKANVAEGISAERFAREIQLVASLQQANIVPLLSAGDANGTPYFTMPYVQGESLRGHLSQGLTLSIAECVSILRDVARALRYAHARGVVHRDIKPDNVLLSHGTAMVTDFGIAKAVSASRTMADHDSLTQVGTSIGTPAYMAPEQVAGDPHVDHRVDLYAWGCLAYELLTGAPPFVKDSPQRVLAAHLGEAPTPVSSKRADVTPQLASLVMHALVKEPDHRIATADDILRELDAAMTPGALTAPSATPAVKKPRTTMVASIVIGIALLVAIAIARNRATSTAASAVPAIDNSIAVMPLANLSGDKSDDYFGIGLAEEITRAIAKTGVRVIGRTSASALLARGLDERAVAKELGVGSLLTGTVQRADSQLRINVSLLSAVDGSIRWSDKYDRPLTNVFAVQDEIARSVANKLLGTIRTAAKASRIETKDQQAYELFLQGQVLFTKRTESTMRQAIVMFETAIARDSAYARAWAGLALSYAVLPSYVYHVSGESNARAIVAAERAIALDSTIAEAYIALGQVTQGVRRIHQSEPLFKRALQLDSTVMTAWGWSGLNAAHLGQMAAARERVSRARALEPASMIARVWDAQVALVDRRYAYADSVSRETIMLDATFTLAWDARGEVLSYLGRHAEAIAVMEGSVARQSSTRPTQAEGILAYVYARAGQASDARRVMAAMSTRNGAVMPAMGVLAATLEVLGDHTGALTLLEKALEEPDGDSWMWQYNRAERYDRLRKDPKAAALLAQLEVM